MPSKFRLRYMFKPIVKVIAKGLSKIGVSANLATVLMLSFSIFSFIGLLLFQNLLIFGILVFFTGILDGVDGSIARINETASSWGGFFDSVMDRISEFIIFLALILYSWNQLLWNLIDMKLIIIVTFIFSFIISYSRARAEIIHKGDFDIGLMARSERLFYIFLSGIIAFFWNFFNELLFLFMWLVIATALFRFFRIKKELDIFSEKKKLEKQSQNKE
ncbi:MAG: CDP-diacylglycerol--inositol 3-phosphatidyltransferase [Promethearchaeota archaeon]|nr:MAG: CDP-diacylglycerol--inositol 3-phosphatidyltransferase [Candidatus Lokiarchaeota archaeon]